MGWCKRYTSVWGSEAKASHCVSAFDDNASSCGYQGMGADLDLRSKPCNYK
jgi:hypothetical protein